MRPPRMLLYADQQLVLAGASELLREQGPRPVSLETVTPGRPLTTAPGLRAALIDLSAVGAEQAVRVLRSRAEAVVLLVGESDGAAGASADVLAQVDAVLIRDELDPDLLDLALEASRRGLWVSSRGVATGVGNSVGRAGDRPVLDPPVLGGDGQTLPDFGAGGPSGPRTVSASDDRGLRALALLADGLRDAEVAAALNLSESATRKLIQRAVQAAGARTRTQAIAAAIRAGQLT